MNRRQFLQQGTAALGAAICAPLLVPSPTVPWDMVEEIIDFDPLVSGIWYRYWSKEMSHYFQSGRLERIDGEPQPLSQFLSSLEKHREFCGTLNWNCDWGIIQNRPVRDATGDWSFG